MANYGISIGKDLERELASMSSAQDVSVEQFIRNAVLTYVYLNKETASGSKKVSITDDQDHVLQDIEIRK